MSRFSSDYEFNKFLFDSIGISDRVIEYIENNNPDLLSGDFITSEYSSLSKDKEFVGYSSEEEFEYTMLYLRENNNDLSTQILYDSYNGLSDYEIQEKYNLTDNEF